LKLCDPAWNTGTRMAADDQGMFVAGKTFHLNGMLNSSVLELQLGNVFQILQLQVSFSFMQAKLLSCVLSAHHP
jgi:hypothetical protein